MTDQPSVPWVVWALNEPAGSIHRHIICMVCKRPGHLESINNIGYLVSHPDRFPCRVPQ